MFESILSFFRGVIGIRGLKSELDYQEKMLWQLKDELHLLRYDTRRNSLIDHILHDTEKGVTTEKYGQNEVIVSLTTYGKRIHEVAFSIESLMQQSMKANRIVLWLDESFKGQPLPNLLIMQQKRGLEIAYCTDIRSFTKLIPQMQTTPDAVIITIDDDILYDYDVLEHLILAYLSSPQMIHSCRVHRMLFDSNGKLMPYNQWDSRCSQLGTDKCNFLTGVGGVLYPPHSLDDEVFNQNVFLDICPDADDVWFTAMAIKKGTPINKVFTRNEHGEDYLEIPYALEQGLAVKNVVQGGNDRQIKAVFDKYKLYDKLI